MDVFLAQRDRLKRISAGLGLAGADIDDCLQDVSVTVLKQGKKRFETTKDCVRWLNRVTINRCLIEHRRRRSFLSKAAEIYRRWRKPPEASAENTAVANEEREQVRMGLQTLDDRLLKPLVLRYFCDLDATQIGEVLDQKPSTVRSRLRDARLELADELLKKGIPS